VAHGNANAKQFGTWQAALTEVWLDRQAEHLLPVEYHHVVFTLPAAPNRKCSAVGHKENGPPQLNILYLQNSTYLVRGDFPHIYLTTESMRGNEKSTIGGES
jgi:hypothetical protein